MTEQKMVPESDLMAIKARFEKEMAEAQSKLLEMSQKADAYYENLLAEQTAKEKLLSELEQLKSELGRLKTVEQDSQKLQAKLDELNKQLLAASVKRLSQVYKIPEDKISNKTLTELSAIEEVLQLIGRDSQRFDTGTIDTGMTRKMSAFEMIKQGLDHR